MAWKLKTVPATTNNLTKAIINDLLSRGHSASRINTQGQFEPANAADFTPGIRAMITALRKIGLVVGRWRKSGSRTGYLDISACIFGRGVVIDIKSGKDRLSKDQKDFITEWVAAGGIAASFGTKAEYDSWYSETFPQSMKPQTDTLL